MTWTHPELGVFEYDDYGWWSGTVELPSFQKFVYDTGEVDSPWKAGQYRLTFDCKGPDDVPSAAAISLVVEIQRHQEQLCAEIIQALWADFQGNGPGSGMWWEGCAEDVVEHVDLLNRQTQSWSGLPPPSLPPLVAADSLYAWMQVDCVSIRKKGGPKRGPSAELDFAALFDPEHGCGFLTDGRKIRGIGYGCDVEPFST